MVKFRGNEEEGFLKFVNSMMFMTLRNLAYLGSVALAMGCGEAPDRNVVLCGATIAPLYRMPAYAVMVVDTTTLNLTTFYDVFFNDSLDVVRHITDGTTTAIDLPSPLRIIHRDRSDLRVLNRPGYEAQELQADFNRFRSRCTVDPDTLPVQRALAYSLSD